MRSAPRALIRSVARTGPMPASTRRRSPSASMTRQLPLEPLPRTKILTTRASSLIGGRCTNAQRRPGPVRSAVVDVCRVSERSSRRSVAEGRVRREAEDVRREWVERPGVRGRRAAVRAQIGRQLRVTHEYEDVPRAVPEFRGAQRRDGYGLDARKRNRDLDRRRAAVQSDRADEEAGEA